MPSRAPSRAPATAALVSASPPSETTRRSSVSASPGRTSAWKRGAGREQAETLIGTVDRARTADRLDEELELLATLQVLDGAEGGARGVGGRLAADERRDAERDGGDRRPAASVDVREGGQGRGELEEQLGSVRVGQAEGRRST